MIRLFRLFYYTIILAFLKFTGNDDTFRKKLIELIKKQGGLYVKFMQVLAMQTGVFRDTYSRELLSLYDNVGYQNIDIEGTLKKELSDEKRSQIKLLDTKPFSSGTFAQVYKAELSNGTPVIIKIKKRNLKAILFFDFLVLTTFIKILDALYDIPLLDPNKLLKRFKRNTYKELDYKSEVKNALFLYDVYKNHPRIKIPITYTEFCTKNVIVQEYISGIPLTHLIRIKSENPEKYKNILDTYKIYIPELLKSIGYELSSQGPRFERFYGDPHPGNIILLGGDKFALIDFGILDKIQIDKRNYYKVMQLVVEMTKDSDLRELSTELLKFGAPDLYKALETLDQNQVFADSEGNGLLDIVATNYSKVLNTKSSVFIGKKEAIGGITEIFYEIVMMGNKFNLKVPDNLFNMMRGSAMYGSFARYLLPEKDVMPEVYKQMLEEFKENLGDKLKSPSNYKTEEALIFLLEWITGIAEKDSMLYSKIRKAANF